MGTTYDFICNACGYTTEASGGNDVGMICATTTILCQECRELYDIVISEEPWLFVNNYQEPNKERICCPESKEHKCRLLLKIF